MERSFLPAIAGFIHRPRIDTLVEKGLKYSLVLVIAGPGYGKTLSVAHYMKTADVRLMWMRASAHRTKAGDYWEDLVQAAQRELPEYAKKLDELGFPDTAGGFEQFREMTDEAAAEGKRIVLVVDNFERIIDVDSTRFVNNLIDSDIHNFTLFILCNAMLPFAEVLPAAGQFRITSEDLAFTLEEAEMMYAQYGVKAPVDVVERANKAAGGWPLGLRLVCESNPNQPAEFPGRTPFQIAADLFEQHYFRRYPRAVQTRLILFSLLPQFALDMGDANQDGVDDVLYDLLMTHPFISHDYSTGLFLFQPMYHDFLRQKQTLLSKESRTETMAHAGRWFIEHGMVNDAMDCFWEAADYDGFLEAIAALPKIRVPASLTNRVLQRLEQIPRGFADITPNVDFAIAFMLLNAGEAKRAREIFLEVTGRLDKMPETEETRLLQGDIYATLADIGTYLNEDSGLGWMKKAIEYIPNGSRTHSAELMSLGNNSVFFLPDGEAGRLEYMVDYFMEYAQYADKVKNGCGHGYEYLFAGEAAYYKEDMEKAATMFNSAMLKAQLTGQHDIICNALWGLGRIEFYYANHKNALALLNEMETYINSNNLVPLFELRDCAAAWFYLRLDALDKVPQWFGEAMRWPDEMPVSFGRRQLMMAHYLFLSGEAAKAYAVMLQLEAGLEKAGRWYERLCLYILKALYYMETGEMEAFEQAFGMAYDMVYQNNIKVVFAAFGKEMMSVLDRVKKLNTGRYDVAWLDEVYKDALSFAKRLQTMRKAYSGEAYQHKPSALALTKRENETLHYLAQGLTQQEIGKLMGISSNAVKKHVSKIYYKLGAVNRADAIHIASINGLVDVLSR